ncbi:MAG: TIGR04372 family glycosyltransferase [Elusimicrobia bacterium]|nr:TIGR04372 family glycosyltransferase [Elusimicrobiota bacterium]
MSPRRADIKRRLKESRLWSAAKYLLPVYHRPMLGLAAARLWTLAVSGPKPRIALAKAWIAVARMRVYEGDWAAAEAACAKAQARDAGLTGAAAAAAAAVHATLADAFARELDDPATQRKAARHYAAAIALDPENPDYCVNAFVLHRYTGDWKTMEDMLDRGLRARRAQASRRGLDERGVRFLGESWLASVGHVGALDYYFKMGPLGLRRGSRIVLPLRPELRVPNRYLLDLWRPFVEIVADPAEAGFTKEDARLVTDEVWGVAFPDGRARGHVPAGIGVQKEWEAQGRPPLLRLFAEDKARGRALLAQRGLPENAWFVCLHVREAGFWSRIDEKHPNARSCELETFFDAVRAITDRGGWVVRIGDAGMKPLPAMERVIDFAHDPEKSERMDVFLCAESRFYLGTASGPANIPPCFGTPLALTNWVPLGAPLWYGDMVWIPKLCWSRAEGRALGFGETFARGLGVQEFHRPYEERGAELRDNTPAQIAALAVEMIERTGGGASYSPDEQRRQTRFDQILTAQGAFPAGRLGRAFLREHEALLEREALRA